VWRSVFSADLNIIGASINLEKRAFTVVGVMPSRFSFPLLSGTREVWVPVGQDPLFESWTNLRARHWLLTTGRLKPGVSLAEAQAEPMPSDSVSRSNFQRKTLAGRFTCSRYNA
jgi:hypothetical protein